MTWIDDGEMAYRQKKTSQDSAQQLQLHHADVLVAKARPLLDELVEVVARDVANYSERFKADPQQRVNFTKMPSGGFKLDKAEYPAASVECSLEGVQIKVVRSSRPGPMLEADVRLAYLGLGVDSNDHAVVKAPPGKSFVSLDDVSKYLIARVLFS